MPPILYAHPFAAYCHKVLIALYENDTPFTFRMVDHADTEGMAAFTALWPIRKFPLLKEGDAIVLEASTIIEHLQIHHPGPVPLIPGDPAEALSTRMMDRVFDNYVAGPQGRIVFDSLRPAADRDAFGVAEARAMLDTIYAWLDKTLQGRTWAAGETFGLADCAAAPSLLYAHWTHPIDARFETLMAYRGRLLTRPSYARVLDEARPYRHLFPLGAPNED